MTVDLSLLARLSDRPGLTNASERAYLDWFHGQSAARLPGVFESGFWDTLLLQATVTEPCVLHAVLALSCAHKSSSVVGSARGSQKSLGPDKHEQFCLRQYSEAIGGLKPHFLSSSKSSIRVALIACVIFTCLEFVRGHYQSGLSHFHCGLRLLGQLKAVSFRASNGVELQSLGKSEQSVDGWLAEQFARLHLQARLFGQSRSSPKVTVQDWRQHQPVTFLSATHARKCLDRLIGDATTLSEQHKAAQYVSPHFLPSPETLEQQSNLQYALASWLEAYEKSCASLAQQRAGKKASIESIIGYKILHSYYLIARITLGTSLRLDGETAFDAFTDDFRIIMRNSAQLGEIVFNDAPGTKFEHDPELSPIVADMGWITPLYFTAIKCRRRDVRQQAIDFLSHGDCKEGIWDAALAAQVAKLVVEIEQQGLGLDPKACNLVDGKEQDEKLPPEASRVFDVDVLLPEGRSVCLGVVCKRRRDDGSIETIARHREAGCGRWIDGAA